MKVEYINTFIEASQSVIRMLTNAETEIGRPYLKASPFYFNQIIIVIGVVGSLRGQIYFEMPDSTALSIASTMMGGMQLDGLDELSKSAISEMGNMIMGNASTLFDSRNIHIDITPPTLLSGERIEMSNKVATVVVPLKVTGYGIINMNINAEEI